MTQTTVKEALKDIIAQLPEECSWDEVMYQIYVRQKIELGLADVAARRTVPHEEVFEEFEETFTPT